MYRVLVYLCLVVLYMASSNLVRASPVDGEVLFDTADEFLIEMPEPCAGKSFCFEKGDMYPEDKVKKVLEKMPVSLSRRVARSLSFREGDDVKGNPDCPVNSTRSHEPIYYIVDENDKVRVVVQLPQKFQQIYSVKWCERPGQITEDTPHFLKGSRTLEKFKIECVNKYMDFDFFVLSDDVYDLKLDIARAKGGIPVCCRCRYSRLGSDYQN